MVQTINELINHNIIGINYPSIIALQPTHSGEVNDFLRENFSSYNLARPNRLTTVVIPEIKLTDDPKGHGRTAPTLRVKNVIDRATAKDLEQMITELGGKVTLLYPDSGGPIFGYLVSANLSDVNPDFLVKLEEKIQNKLKEKSAQPSRPEETDFSIGTQTSETQIRVAR